MNITTNIIELKAISKDAIPEALAKAEHYRMINEPFEAASICMDVLAVDAENEKARIIMLLALTDQFKEQLNPAFPKAQELVSQLGDSYCKEYYGGIVCERRAKVHMGRGEPGSGHLAHEWFKKAMDHFERALAGCASNTQEAVLRWNTCARIIMDNPEIRPGEEDAGESMLE
jgi:hypothetical protein